MNLYDELYKMPLLNAQIRQIQDEFDLTNKVNSFVGTLPQIEEYRIKLTNELNVLIIDVRNKWYDDRDNIINTFWNEVFENNFSNTLTYNYRQVIRGFVESHFDSNDYDMICEELADILEYNNKYMVL